MHQPGSQHGWFFIGIINIAFEDSSQFGIIGVGTTFARGAPSCGLSEGRPSSTSLVAREQWLGAEQRGIKVDSGKCKMVDVRNRR